MVLLVLQFLLHDEFLFVVVLQAAAHVADEARVVVSCSRINCARGCAMHSTLERVLERMKATQLSMRGKT